ncbi:Zinc finger BED domain-containing protein [Actinidia chinensis var. chinensis]|uniref:Zinc finger BED domain-containing protein n=1 Tax=Actinidia chinensis var. chinensis TaxID=1590841 RepID=A0A2R6P4J7_ACTCC|nr:Zinc finger BED domain-containing protein [Actinidia chinensis var. chinensis]
MAANEEFDESPDTEMSSYHFKDGSEDGGNDDDHDVCATLEYDAKEASRSLAMLVCTEDLSPRIVENHFFLRYVHSLNPIAKLDSVETLKTNCLKYYAEEEVKIKHVLKNLDWQISLSVDILRSPSYMRLTAHFINDTWKLKKWVLKFHVLRNNVLPNAIQNALSYWDIESKISAITLKSGSENDETVEKVKDHLQKTTKLRLNGQLFHVYCSADLFSLMAQDALHEITEIIDKVNEIMPWGNSLPLWCLTTSRLKEALELEPMGEYSPQNGPENCNTLSVDEWVKVRGICRILDKLHEVAKVLFHTKYPTVSIYLVYLQQLRTSLTQEGSSSDGFVRAVIEKMLQKLDKYWKDMFLVLAVATVMDPRSKMKYIEYLSMKYKGEGSDFSFQVSSVYEAICSLFDDNLARFVAKENSASDSTSSDSKEEEDFDSEKEEDSQSEKMAPPTKKRKVKKVSRHEEGSKGPNCGSNHLQDYSAFAQSTNQSSKSDLDWYLEEPVIPWSEDFNLLKWWRDASPKYPVLSRMARDLLAIPISVVTADDAYYTEERKVDPRLISSGQDLINALMCTRSWYKKH